MSVETVKWIAAGAALVASACRDPRSDTEITAEGKPMAGEHACNFQASYMTWDLPPRPDSRPDAKHNIPLGNKARIQLEAIVEVTDDDTGTTEQFVLIAPCRTEWVYAEHGLFQIPSREYRNIYSLREQRAMGRGITYDGETTRATPISDHFRSIQIDVVRFAASLVLDSPQGINEATARNVPLTGRTELRDKQRTYILEYPIKTMNFRPENSSFQVDTGPLLVPDFDSAEPKLINRLEMAHIAYNRLDRAEFILRRPTAITGDAGRELTTVLHYSEVKELAATTRILTGEG